MTSNDTPEGALSQIEHPDREYVDAFDAFPEDVQKQIAAEALVKGFEAKMKQWIDDDPMGFLESFDEASQRSRVGDPKNHRQAEGYA